MTATPVVALAQLLHGIDPAAVYVCKPPRLATVPDAQLQRHRTEALVENTDFLFRVGGLPLDRIADRLGLRPGTLERTLERHAPDLIRELRAAFAAPPSPVEAHPERSDSRFVGV